MALTPQAMMMLRRGPAMGPTPTPGGGAPGAPPGAGPPGAPPGAAAGIPSTPGAASPGNILMTAIANRINQEKKANTDFGIPHLEQQKRVLSVMGLHYQEQHPEVARHLNRAWASIDQALKALKDAQGDQAMAGPPLGFSGAQIGPSDQMGAMGGGPMGVPR
jgi:hypothetical protein